MPSSRLSVWGVGPWIVSTAGGYACVAGIATYVWPQVCLIRSVPQMVFVGGRRDSASCRRAAAGNRGPGCHAGLWPGRAGDYGHLRGDAETRSTRHGSCSSFPGWFCCRRRGPLLLTPIVAYVVFKMLIGRESRYLEERFGEEYRAYRAKVNELVPMPRFRQKSCERT